MRHSSRDRKGERIGCGLSSRLKARGRYGARDQARNYPETRRKLVDGGGSPVVSKDLGRGGRCVTKQGRVVFAFLKYFVWRL